MANLLCKCGHSAFYHAFRGPHPCLGGGDDGCDCERFVSAEEESSPAIQRRYALLQAAATLLGAPICNGEQWTTGGAALTAIELLAEIERREKEGK